MNLTRNPRIAQRRQEQVWGRLMMINAENLAVLALTLSQTFPKIFYAKAVRGFFDNYVDTVATFDTGSDSELKEHRIREHLRGCPYITDELVGRLVRYFKGKAVTRLDRAIYAESNLVGLLAENLTLMLIQLHFDYSFGEERILRTVDAVCASDFPDPMKTLDELFDIAPQEDTAQLRAEVRRMEQYRRESKRHDRNEVSNRQEAERCLQEFRQLMQKGD